MRCLNLYIFSLLCLHDGICDIVSNCAISFGDTSLQPIKVSVSSTGRHESLFEDTSSWWCLHTEPAINELDEEPFIQQ